MNVSIVYGDKSNITMENVIVNTVSLRFILIYLFSRTNYNANNL
jgi:hypothetical protein